MESKGLSCVVVGPSKEKAEASVVWLHGLGADGHDFEPIVPHLGLDLDKVRFIFPHAPKIPVTINAGFVMPAWYDIKGLELGSGVDVEGIERSKQQVSQVIQNELTAEIPAAKLVLAGFSQGGAIALHLALTSKVQFAGILALSTYLPPPIPTSAERSDANLNTPMLMMHGTHDPMVTVDRGEAAYRAFKSWGYSATWRTFPMAHEVTMPQIREIGEWLQVILKKKRAE